MFHVCLQHTVTTLNIGTFTKLHLHVCVQEDGECYLISMFIINDTTYYMKNA
jgi:hypothetical protein